MRNIIIGPALAVSVLSGCATVPDGSGGTTTGIDPAIIAEVKAIATQVCGFEPTAATVLNIVATFTGGGPIVGLADQVAQGICGAVTSLGAASRSGPRYRGVVVHGRFKR